MRYVKLVGFGGPEVLHLDEKPIPVPDEDEVLIRVAAAGVNRPDLLQRQGLYHAPAGADPVLGLEVSGVVEKLGLNVTALSVGDRVCALTNGGGYAEYVAVPAAQVLTLAQDQDLVFAAGLPEALFTVWANVFDRGQLRSGETLLIHGGSGGIGSVAIQMAKQAGARVMTTASSDAKCQLCKQLGADIVANYLQEDFVSVAKAHGGVDVVLDCIGGDYLARNLAICNVDARIVCIGFMQGSCVQVDLMRLMSKRITLTGSVLRSRSNIDKASMAKSIRQLVWPTVTSGLIKPVIHEVFSLDDVRQAHWAIESGGIAGKILVCP